MKKKKIFTALLSLLILCSSTSVFAGTWEKKVYNDGTYSWKYKQDDGVYVAKGWKQIDGDWYYFRGKSMLTNHICYTLDETGVFHKYGAPAYYVGSDGKWVTQGGFYSDEYGQAVFLDSDGVVATDFFMVDDVLYHVDVSNTGGYTIHSINTTYRGEASDKFQCADGKERTLHYIKDGGKVLDLDGTPISESDPEDENFFSLIKYIPKYNSQGQLVGEIRN